jgi:hypothetical protein
VTDVYYLYILNITVFSVYLWDALQIRNENIFDEDEFLSFSVTDRPYNQVTEPANAPSSTKDNNEVGTSAGFMKVSPKIIRPFPEAEPRTTRRRKGKRKYSGKTLGKKIVKNLITVDSVSKCKTE